MRHGIIRVWLVCGIAVSGVLLSAVAASAHVTVHSDDAVSGASDAAVMFRTPNEEDHAATVKLQVFFPRRDPLLDVLVEPHPGWASKTRTAQLAKPVRTDDGQITSAVSEVTWTADSQSTGLQPGEAADFVVIAGQLPHASSVTFRALQTYSNGDVARWIETQAPGAAEPDHPAPVLALASNQAAGSSRPAVVGGAGRSTASSDSTARGLAIAALVVALIAAGLGARTLVRRP
jgi:uncharacterized protein YcnI